MRRWSWLIVGSVLAISACGHADGVVTSKDYDPPSTIVQCMPIGNNPCFPMVEPVSECWKVTVASGDYACVDKSQWDRIHLGDEFHEG